MKIQKTYSCIQENVARKLPNVLCGHSEKDRRRISPIISAFDRMKNDSRYVISISKEKHKESGTNIWDNFCFQRNITSQLDHSDLLKNKENN